MKFKLTSKRKNNSPKNNENIKLTEAPVAVADKETVANKSSLFIDEREAAVAGNSINAEKAIVNKINELTKILFEKNHEVINLINENSTLAPIIEEFKTAIAKSSEVEDIKSVTDKFIKEFENTYDSKVISKSSEVANAFKLLVNKHAELSNVTKKIDYYKEFNDSILDYFKIIIKKLNILNIIKIFGANNANEAGKFLTKLEAVKDALDSATTKITNNYLKIALNIEKENREQILEKLNDLATQLANLVKELPEAGEIKTLNDLGLRHYYLNFNQFVANLNTILKALTADLKVAIESGKKLSKEHKKYIKNTDDNASKIDWDLAYEKAVREQRSKEFFELYFGPEGPWGENGAIVEQLGDAFMLEVNNFGFDQKENPFIAYLNILFKLHQNKKAWHIVISNLQIAYPSIHNAYVKRIITDDDLRGKNNLLGTKAIIFTAAYFKEAAPRGKGIEYIQYQNECLKLYTSQKFATTAMKNQFNQLGVANLYALVMFNFKDSPLKISEAKAWASGINYSADLRELKVIDNYLNSMSADKIARPTEKASKEEKTVLSNADSAIETLAANLITIENNPEEIAKYLYMQYGDNIAELENQFSKANINLDSNIDLSIKSLQKINNLLTKYKLTSENIKNLVAWLIGA